MNIYLIGMMGSGKSTVGKHLSVMLGIPFLDLDHYIEVKHQKSIADIFKEYGEARFRELEFEALSQIETSSVLVACGGGIILDSRNRKKLQSSGKVVFLKASIPELTKRLGNVTNRPLLKEKAVRKELNHIWQKRKDFYEKTAHLTVDTKKRSPKEISEDIFNRIKS